MPKLTDDHKAFIVKELAMFSSPTQVVNELRVQFGIEVHRRQVHEYDPLGSRGHRVAPKWLALHKATRQAFLSARADIGISHRNVRLQQLDKILRDAMAKGNYSLAMAAMEQAAKEMGEWFSKKPQREQAESNPYASWSDEELAARRAELEAKRAARVLPFKVTG